MHKVRAGETFPKWGLHDFFDQLAEGTTPTAVIQGCRLNNGP
jgi:hypothetical protein